MKQRDMTRDSGNPRRVRPSTDTGVPTLAGSAATRAYARAYETQYGLKDLVAAIEAYGQLIDSYPGSPEAGYSRAQIQGIARQVLPEDALRRAHTAMVLEHLRATGYAPATEPRS